MSYVTLSLAKAHLAIMHDDDDTLIQQCLDAAEAHAASIMGRRSISDIQDQPWIIADDTESTSQSEVNTVPLSVVQGILMFCAEFYENRTVSVIGVSRTENPAAMALLHMHRMGLGV